MEGDVKNMANKNKPQNTLFTKTVNNINSSISNVMSSLRGISGEREKDIDSMVKATSDIIDREINKQDTFTNPEYQDVYSRAIIQDAGTTNRNKTITLEDVLEDDRYGLFEYAKNRELDNRLLMEDYYLITEDMFEMERALETAIDSVASSDKSMEIIARTISLEGGGDGESNDSADIEALHQMEEKYNLLQRHKDIIYKETIRYGEYYLYVAPYRDIFEASKHRRAENYAARGQYTGLSILESAEPRFGDSSDTVRKKEEEMEAFLESAIDSFDDIVGKTSNSKQKENIKSTMKSVMDNVIIGDGASLIENLEEVPVEVALEVAKQKMNELNIGVNKEDSFTNMTKKEMKGAFSGSDGSISVNELKGVGSNKRRLNDNNDNSDYSDIKGSYVKYLDPRKVIPIEIMETIVGYYYVHPHTNNTNKRKIITGGYGVNMAKDLDVEVENDFINRLSEQISNSMSDKFVQNNVEFRQSIASALTFFDVYRRNVTVQFIPKEHIVRYQINPDENGRGQSMFSKSLFYARLYLILTKFKFLTIIQKSNDQRFYFVNTAEEDKRTSSSIQNTIRQLQQRQFQTSDMTSYLTLSSRAGAGRDAFVSQGSTGKRPFDMEIVEGQHVELNSDFMQSLHDKAIASTGTPSAFINLQQEVDFARTLNMINSGYNRRISGYKSDLSKSTTETYRKLARAEGFPDSVVNRIKVTLDTSDMTEISNLASMIGDVKELSEFIATVFIGDNHPSEDKDRIIELTISQIVKERAPSLQMEKIESYYENAVVQVNKEKQDMDQQ